MLTRLTGFEGQNVQQMTENSFICCWLSTNDVTKWVVNKLHDTIYSNIFILQYIQIYLFYFLEKNITFKVGICSNNMKYGV